LDEKAVERVQQYKFKPAMKDGKPVAMQMNIEVNFEIY
jgi:protein TonB